MRSLQGDLKTVARGGFESQTREVGTTSNLPDVVALLGELVAEVKALRAGQRALDAKLDAILDSPPVATDADVAFVLAIAGSSVGGSVFSAADLCAHAAMDDVLRRAIDGRSAVHVGRRLHALKDRDLGGFVVQRVKRDAAGIMWCVVPASDLHADAGADSLDGAR